MSLITVLAGSSATISQSENDSVLFLGAGTLNIAGTAQNPITVTLSQVAGIGLLDTINIANADVALAGVVGVSALTAYNIGSGGTLRIQSSIGISVGSTIRFSAVNSHLVLSSGVDLSLLGSISGFGPGSTIDVSGVATSLVYNDNAGANTGGTVTLRDSNGTTVATLALGTGDFIPANFALLSDGSGGTIVAFATAISAVSATPTTAILKAGSVALFQVTTTNPVTIGGGAPTLALNDGGVATYDPSTSTSTALMFRYVVQAGQNAADLAITGFALNGAVVSDAAGNAASLSGAIGNPAGVLQVDTTAPTVTGVITLPGNGTLTAGQSVEIDVGISEAVTVSGGAPTLTLSDGGTAAYDPTHSTATTLAFTHLVQPGQNSPDLAVTGVSINGATIADMAGNAADLSAVVRNPAGILQIGSGSMNPAPNNPTPTGPTPTTPNSSNPVTLDVYRFFDTVHGTHFYTSDSVEREAVLHTRHDLVSEGIGLTAVDPAANDPNAVPVFRFFDSVYGTHFFTASSTERDAIIGSRPDLHYEATSTFYEHAQPQPDDTAVYRFFDQSNGTHFYTDSESERASIIQHRPDLIAEGVGFYEPKPSSAT